MKRGLGSGFRNSTRGGGEAGEAGGDKNPKKSLKGGVGDSGGGGGGVSEENTMVWRSAINVSGSSSNKICSWFAHLSTELGGAENPLNKMCEGNAHNCV